jgi:hypothetical protein
MTSLKVPLRTVKQALDGRASPLKGPSPNEVSVARHMLADRFEAQAAAAQPDRHLLISMLKEAADLIFDGAGEPPLAEMTHLGLAARGLRSPSPKFWHYSAQHGACALRDPVPHPAAPGIPETRFTRQQLDTHLDRMRLAKAPPRRDLARGTPNRDAKPSARPIAAARSATRGQR